MASLFGKQIHKGSWGLPELGVTEAIGRVFGTPTTSRGGSNVIRDQNNPSQQVQWNALQSYPSGTGIPRTVASTTTPGGNTGGGGGGGGGGGNQDQGGGIPLESAPNAPDYSFFEAQIQPAIDVLSGLENETRTLLGGGEQQADAFTTAEEAAAQTERTGAERDVQRRLGQGQTQAGEAENVQRRGFSEISQNLLGRFGRTGFGQGIIGSLGESTLQNVGRIRSDLQNFTNDLNIRREQIDDIFNERSAEIKRAAEQIKLEAKTNLQAAIANISQSKAQLLGARAEMISNALSQYQQIVSGVNARNAQFQQTLHQQKEAARQKVQELRTRASVELNSLPNLELTKGQSRVLGVTPNSALDKQFAEGTQVAGGLNFDRKGNLLVVSNTGLTSGTKDPYEENQ